MLNARKLSISEGIIIIIVTSTDMPSTNIFNLKYPIKINSNELIFPVAREI